ncbi:hypothetical protein L218DRAFT_510864 [Marasmius fiardii PR-910]|nr:hypothetical protein L218DRAFT_510864 [Marasmius fiardii PR-910]
MRFLFLFLPHYSLSLSLWDPTGPYHVSYTQYVLDHITPDDPTEPGNIMLLTIHYPTRQVPNTTVAYLNPVTASIYDALSFPNGSLTSLTTSLQFQAPTLLGTSPEFGNGTSPYPTIIFLPGAGVPALLYTAYQSELASYGYTIVSIDHPGEAPYIQLPNDGGGIFSTLPSTLEAVRGVYNYRVSDVLAMMSDAFLPSLIRTWGAPINTTHFGIIGHSIGGAGAAGVMASNNASIASLFKIGGNIDGSFTQFTNSTLIGVNTSIPVPDLNRPFLELAAEDHFNGSETNSPLGDHTWEYFNAGQSGWRRNFQVDGTKHLDFSDIPLWVERLGGRDGLLVGDANGDWTTHTVATILRKFIGYMEGKGLQGVDEYTETVPELFLLSEGGNE